MLRFLRDTNFFHALLGLPAALSTVASKSIIPDAAFLNTTASNWEWSENAILSRGQGTRLPDILEGPVQERFGMGYRLFSFSALLIYQRCA